MDPEIPTEQMEQFERALRETPTLHSRRTVRMRRIAIALYFVCGTLLLLTIGWVVLSHREPPYFRMASLIAGLAAGVVWHFSHPDYDRAGE